MFTFPNLTPNPNRVDRADKHRYRSARKHATEGAAGCPAQVSDTAKLEYHCRQAAKSPAGCTLFLFARQEPTVTIQPAFSPSLSLALRRFEHVISMEPRCPAFSGCVLQPSRMANELEVSRDSPWLSESSVCGSITVCKIEMPIIDNSMKTI